MKALLDEPTAVRLSVFDFALSDRPIMGYAEK
jgi:hypothetical protein